MHLLVANARARHAARSSRPVCRFCTHSQGILLFGVCPRNLFILMNTAAHPCGVTAAAFPELPKFSALPALCVMIDNTFFSSYFCFCFCSPFSRICMRAGCCRRERPWGSSATWASCRPQTACWQHHLLNQHCRIRQRHSHPLRQL